MSRSTPKPAVLAFALLALVPFAAFGEAGDRDKPINIEADRMSLDDIKKESHFEGNVTLTQGTLMLRADRATVTQDPDGFNYATAWGKPAYFRQKRDGIDEYIEGWAERMEYDGRKDKVQLFTTARVLKGGTDEVRGDYISYDAVTEFYQVIGGGKTAASPGNPQGRVRAVIQPKRRDDAAQPGRPAAGAAPAGAAAGATPSGAGTAAPVRPQ